MPSSGEAEVNTADRKRRGSATRPAFGKPTTSKAISRVPVKAGKSTHFVEDTSDNDGYVSRKPRKLLNAGVGKHQKKMKQTVLKIEGSVVGVQKRISNEDRGNSTFGGKKMVVTQADESASDSGDDSCYQSASCSVETVNNDCSRGKHRVYKKTDCFVSDLHASGEQQSEDKETDGDDNITLDVSCTETAGYGNQDKQGKQYPHYRCNLHGVVSDLCSFNLREDHLNAIRRTPCWYFVEAALEMGMAEHATYKKCDAVIAEIVKLSVSNRFNETRGFQFGETVLCPTREDFEFTFGIRNGTVPIKSGSLGHYDFVRRCWPHMDGRRFHVTKNIVLPVLLEKISVEDDDEHVVEDVARLVFIYLLATLFIPNPNYRVPWTAMKYLDDFGSICKYDWCTFMLTGLMKGVQTTVNLNVQHCSIFLMFWFCEVCPIIKPRKHGVHFPRFRKWSLVDMKNEFVKLDLQTLDKKFVLRKEFTALRKELRYIDGKYPRVIERVKVIKVVDTGTSCAGGVLEPPDNNSPKMTSRVDPAATEKMLHPRSTSVIGGSGLVLAKRKESSHSGGDDQTVVPKAKVKRVAVAVTSGACNAFEPPETNRTLEQKVSTIDVMAPEEITQPCGIYVVAGSETQPAQNPPINVEVSEECPGVILNINAPQDCQMMDSHGLLNDEHNEVRIVHGGNNDSGMLMNVNEEYQANLDALPRNFNWTNYLNDNGEGLVQEFHDTSHLPLNNIAFEGSAANPNSGNNPVYQLDHVSKPVEDTTELQSGDGLKRTDLKEERIRALENEAVTAIAKVVELETLYSESLARIVEYNTTITVKDAVQVKSVERVRILEDELKSSKEKMEALERLYSTSLKSLAALNSDMVSKESDRLQQVEQMQSNHAMVVEGMTVSIGKLEKQLADSNGIRNALSGSLQRSIEARKKLEAEVKQLKSVIDKRTDEYNRAIAENADYAVRDDDSLRKITKLIAEAEIKDLHIEEITRSASKDKSPASGQELTIWNNEALVDYSCTPTDGAGSKFTGNIFAGTVGTPLKPSNLFADAKCVADTPGSSSGMKPPLYPSVKKEKCKGDTPTYSSPVSIKQNPESDQTEADVQYVTPIASVGSILNSEAVINSDSPVNDAVKLARKTEKEAHAVIQREGSSKEDAIVVDSADGLTASRIRRMRLNKKCEATKHVPVYIINWVGTKFRVKEETETILTVNTSSLSAELRLGDMETIINHQRFNDSIIDAWALLVVTDYCGGQKMRDTRSAVGMKPFIFSSCVWQYAARCNVRESYSEAAISFIDKKIPAAVMHENWIIPINTSGDKCPLTFDGDHWTLLHYNTRQNKWTFFNSIAPPIDQDYHYQKSTILLDYVEQSVRGYCNSTGLNLPVANCRSTTTRDCNVPQQSKTSLECGPIVCYLIEMLIHGQEFSRKNWTNASGGEYRGHMVKCFYEAIMRTAPVSA